MATRNLSKSSCMEVGDISDVSIEKCSVILWLCSSLIHQGA
jgi:hypothetical protein